MFIFFFFKQKTAYEMRISDWSSDVCSSDLITESCRHTLCSLTRISKMVVLNFTLTPEAASKIHDFLVCLGKFRDTVAIEARRDRVGPISALKRSEESRVGKECVSPCRSRWWPYP